MQNLLQDIVHAVSDVCPEVNEYDLMQIRSKVAGILAMYDIRPAIINSGHPDIAEKVKQFLSAKKLEGCSEHTISNYALQLQVFANYVNKPIEDITTQDIRAYLSSFHELKNSSIASKLHILKSLFGWLTDEEIIDRDPVRKIKAPKAEARYPKALSVEELEITRESCVTLRQRALVECLYATGCRLSEMQQLNKQDVDWQNREAQVIGKGNKERTVFFSFRALFHLKKYLNAREDEGPALFVTERRPCHRLSNRGIQREVANIGELAGLKKKLHPHVLRHTLATILLNQGADITTVQSILGHEDPGTTQVYAQISNHRRKEQYFRFHVA